MTRPNDEAFDEVVRGGLATRDPGMAPESLRRRIASISEATSSTDRQRTSLRRLGSIAGLAAAAAVGLVFAGLVAVRWVGLPSVGSAPTPTALPAGIQPVWPPLVPGSPSGPDLRPIIVGATIAILFAAVWIVRVRRTRRIRQLVAIALVVMFACLLGVETLYTPIVEGSVGGPIEPADRAVDPDPVSGGKPVAYVDYRSGGAFQIGFSIRNNGPLAVTFDGVGDVLALNDFRFFRFVDLRLPRDQTLAMGSTDDTTQAFRPVDLAPGADLYMVARFRFTTCEEANLPVVPGVDAPETDTSQGYMSIGSIPIRSHALLFERITDLSIPIAAAFPQPTRCAH